MKAAIMANKSRKKIVIKYDHEFQGSEDLQYPDHSRDAHDYATDLMW